MTPAQLHVVQHSLGVDEHGQGTRYRNYYVAGDPRECESLVVLGFMKARAAMRRE